MYTGWQLLVRYAVVEKIDMLVDKYKSLGISPFFYRSRIIMNFFENLISTLKFPEILWNKSAFKINDMYNDLQYFEYNEFCPETIIETNRTGAT